MDSKFDGIRPYYDSEIPSAVERMSNFEFLDGIANFLKMESRDELLSLLFKCSKVDDFQNYIMAFVVNRILKNSAAEITYSGLDYFTNNEKHLILANHRDIVLDSAIIQLIFHNNKVNTTEIAVGDNLISSEFIEDVARSNKMIKVTRSSSPLEVYNSSKLLSEYIRSKVATNQSSIWIAQRNGRTKNGKDLTEQGLLKMLYLSGEDNFVENLDELRILPVAISYEYEPCAVEKTQEIYISKRQKYVKAPDEDFNSIVSGMSNWKGNISINFTEPITHEEMVYCSQYKKNDRFLELAKIIDRQIYSSYKLWPNNYVAAYLLTSEDRYKESFTPEDRERFVDYLENSLQRLNGDREELKDIFLKIYANPLFSYESLG